MFRRAVLRGPLYQSPLYRKPFSRPYANKAPTSQSRIERLNRRLPKFLHKYTNALATAPVSHITSFILLHEITATIPLVGLAAAFHYTQWVPSSFANAKVVVETVDMISKYLRREGMIQSEEASRARREARNERAKTDKAWDLGQGAVRIMVEIATAYAVTKMLLPLRIMVSVWATPWFASKTIVPVTRLISRMLGRGKSKAGAPGAGTGAIDARAVPRAASKTKERRGG